MVDLKSIRFRGTGLNRPECVLTAANGRIYVSDFHGGVTVIEPDGRQWMILSSEKSFQLKPNGILIEESGSFLVAHLGDDDGGVFRLYPNGTLEPVLLEVEGQKLPPTNFVYMDHHKRMWITVSTRMRPRALGYRGDNRDGFIVCVDTKGARIVADDLGYTNECVIEPGGNHLFVNETFTRELSRFEVTSDGRLINKEIIHVFEEGEFPDGLALDVLGGVWTVCIVSNRVIRIDRNGKCETIIQETHQKLVDEVEKAYRANQMEAYHLRNTQSRMLKNISSIAFGGNDLRTVFLGCLLGEELPYFRSPIPGCAPRHWSFEGPLFSYSQGLNILGRHLDC